MIFDIILYWKADIFEKDCRSVKALLIFGERMQHIMIEKLSKENWIQNGIISGSEKQINFNFKMHCHDFYEIEYILSGSGDYILDGRHINIKPNMIFFMSPINFHSVYPNNVRLINIMFDGNICNQSFLLHLTEKAEALALELSGSDKNIVEAVLKELIENITNYDYSVALLNCVLAKLAGAYSGCSSAISASQKASLYILNNFRNNITLHTIASYVGFSPTYFSEIFKTETGRSFKEYLSSLRLEYARNLVMFSDKSITQICTESGFNDYANFIRKFKLRFGESPGKYRRLSKA